MLIRANFDEDNVGGWASGPLECPVCGGHGGSVDGMSSCEFEDSVDYKVSFSCNHGHSYEIVFSNMNDSIGTLIWMVVYVENEFEDE